MTQPVITLTTDFGFRDGFVGVMKGVIYKICPSANVVDLTHQVPPQDIMRAALVLQASAPYFSKGCIHVAVVDPGVGTRRRAIALQTPNATFIGPDNGVLGLVWKEAVDHLGVSNLQVVELTQSRYFMPEVSNTFHGRDVFAPVAAHLACGAKLEDLGPVVMKITPAPMPEVLPQNDGSLLGEVIAIDNFGNCITNLTRADVLELGPAEQLKVSLSEEHFSFICKTYAEVEPGANLAIFGSSGRLELALRNGNLSEKKGLARGAAVAVSRS